MRLNESRIEAVSDLGRARDFYERQLGLVPEAEEDGGIRYPCAQGTGIFIYLSPQTGGTSKATVAGWFVTDLDETISELASRGVVFEQYDQPGIKTDERGIFDNERLRAAWVRDPDGNIIALTQVRR